MQYGADNTCGGDHAYCCCDRQSCFHDFVMYQDQPGTLLQRDHPKSAPPVAAMARLAGDAWARLSPGQRRPYEAACAAAKAEYARLKALPPQLRTVQEDGFLGAEAEATTNTPQV